MVRRKRPSSAYEPDGGFVEDANPSSAKRAKTSAQPSRPASKPDGTGVDDDGNEYWALNDKGNRRVTINKFGGRWMVNIREYYEKDEKWLPGKKGISLTMEQYEAFVGAMPAIEGALRAKGETVPRPRYEGVVEEKMGEVAEERAEGEDEDVKTEDVKKNFEETSEEEG